MKKVVLFLLLFAGFHLSAQLQDVKILVPKESGFNYYDMIQFFPDGKHYVTLANSLTLFDAETSEIIDEYPLTLGAKNLSISGDGKYILVTVNNEVMILTHENDQLKLHKVITTAELIKGLPNSQYYGALPVGCSFFTGKTHVFYIAIGSFTLLWDLDHDKAISSHAFELSQFVLHGAEYTKENAVILAVSSGTQNSLVQQSLQDLQVSAEVFSNKTSIYKIRLKDSLLFCFTTDFTFAYDLFGKKIIHEIPTPKFDYSTYGYDKSSLSYLKDLNKRVPRTIPDTLNFPGGEAIMDVDYNSKTGLVYYATSRKLKVMELRSKKIKQVLPLSVFNLRLSNTNKLVCNAYSRYNSMMVLDPNTLQLLSERIARGKVVYGIGVSPDARYMFTNSGAESFVWDLRTLTKVRKLSLPQVRDSFYVSNAFFLNDSELVVNGGPLSGKKDLMVYNILNGKFGRTLKKNVTAIASGFNAGCFYYCDYQYLHIIDLGNGKEEKYKGLYSMAAVPGYNVVEFNSKHVFVPEGGKFKVVSRSNGAVVYESQSWGVQSRVFFSEDGKSLFVSGVINKKKNFNGYEAEIPVNAVLRIDISTKQVVNDYAETVQPYEIKLSEDRKMVRIWYLKNPAGGDSILYESVYAEYEVESGKKIYSKVMLRSKEPPIYKMASHSGMYFSLSDSYGNLLRVFDGKGNELLDLSAFKIPMAKCFFDEERKTVYISSQISPVITVADLGDRKLKGQIINGAGDDYFLLTEDMHYMGNKEFVKQLRFKYTNEIFSFDQFDAYLNQPHMVLRKFDCIDSLLIRSYEKAYQKRMKVLGIKPGSVPDFKVLPSLHDVQLTQSGDKIEVKFMAMKGKQRLKKLEVYNNGTLVRTIDIPQDDYKGLVLIEPASGLNQIELILKDQAGFESPRITRFYNNTKQVKPDLYLVVMASEKFANGKFDLYYAAKDAKDVATTMMQSGAFAKIHVKQIYNKTFTTDSIRQLKLYLSKAGVNDLVMLFFAGHGYLDQDLSYYFPTYYTDFNDPKVNSVSYTEFENLFNEIRPMKKLMFIDACFSGEVDNEGGEEVQGHPEKQDSARAVSSKLFSQSTALELSKTVFSELRKNTGATVISSAGGTEAAYEDEKWNNGLFTYCLLKGLKEKMADLNKDGKIHLSELQKYVSEEVNRISDGKQTPTYRIENTILDYELW